MRDEQLHATAMKTKALSGAFRHLTHGREVNVLQIVQYVVNACEEPLERGRIHQLLLGQLGFIRFTFLLLLLDLHFSGH